MCHRAIVGCRPEEFRTPQARLIRPRRSRTASSRRDERIVLSFLPCSSQSRRRGYPTHSDTVVALGKLQKQRLIAQRIVTTVVCFGDTSSFLRARFANESPCASPFPLVGLCPPRSTYLTYETVNFWSMALVLHLIGPVPSTSLSLILSYSQSACCLTHVSSFAVGLYVPPSSFA